MLRESVFGDSRVACVEKAGFWFLRRNIQNIVGPRGDSMSQWPEMRARSFGGTIPLTGASENLLSRNEQEQLRRIATVVNCRRGTVIFSEGEEARFVYFMDEGIVRISRCA